MPFPMSSCLQLDRLINQQFRSTAAFKAVLGTDFLNPVLLLNISGVVFYKDEKTFQTQPMYTNEKCELNLYREIGQY